MKLSLAGHEVTFVGQAAEIHRMAADGLVVNIPLRKSDDMVRLATGRAGLVTPAQARPADADMVILAMQEPQYAAPEVQALLQEVAAAGVPCLSLMNLPPPPFLARLGIEGAVTDGVFASAPAWAGFAPELISNASPDPQALRMDPARPGDLTVTLPSNFKAAPFERAADQAVLEQLARDLSRLTVPHDGAQVMPPVKMLVSSSPFVALVKWPMLLAGNCRCVTDSAPLSIAEAVHADLAHSRRVYAAVTALVAALGTPAELLVPFEAYARAAESLVRPSSAARALAGGAQRIERIDLLVLKLMQARDMDCGLILPIVSRIETRLAENRSK